MEVNVHDLIERLKCTLALMAVHSDFCCFFAAVQDDVDDVLTVVHEHRSGTLVDRYSTGDSILNPEEELDDVSNWILVSDNIQSNPKGE